MLNPTETGKLLKMNTQSTDPKDMTDGEILTEFDSYGTTFLDLDEAKLIKSRRRKLAEEFNRRNEIDEGFRTGQRTTRVLVP